LTCAAAQAVCPIIDYISGKTSELKLLKLLFEQAGNDHVPLFSFAL
jgi:hypothetical protein